MKVYVIFVVVLCGVGLSHAKSIRRKAVCRPPEPEDDCYNICDDILYFYSKDHEKCDNCMFCPKGQEPDHISSCFAQAAGIEVKCAPCSSDHYSNSESQDRCFPCHQCLNKVTVTVCTATTDTVCGGCKPGYYEDGGYCSHCGDHLSNKQKEAKGCPLPGPSTSNPTTTEETTTPIQQTSKLPSAPKQTNISIANIRRTTTASTPKSDPSSDKEVVDIHLKHQTGQIGIIALGVVIVLVAVIIGVCRIVKTCTKTCNSSGMGKSYQSTCSFSSSTTRTTHTDSDAKDANGDSSSSSYHSCVEVMTKQNEPAVPNFDVNMSKKKYLGKSLVLHPERVEVQKSPNEEKEKQTKPKSAPPGKPSNMQGFTNYQNAAINNLNHDKVVMNSENGQAKKRERSMSVPAISIDTSNQLDSIIDNTKVQDILNRFSDASSGDESDQGQGEKDTLLKPRKPQPNCSTTLKVPPVLQRFRRRSVASCGPLRQDGGKLSSGSAQDDFAPDITMSTNSKSIKIESQSIGSLSSDPNKVVKGKKRDRLTLKRQQSYDNGMMEVLEVDDDSACEIDPLLVISGTPKGVQPQEHGDCGLPALASSYQDLYKQYGGLAPPLPLLSNQNQELVAKCNIPLNGLTHGHRTLDSGVSAPQDPEPIAKCDTTAVQTPRTNNTITASPPSARRSSASRSMPSTSRQPGAHGLRTGLPVGNGPQITHVHYHGPVINAEGGTNLQFALGNNSNQIQQGASGAGSSDTRHSTTPEGNVPVPCSDDGRETSPSYV